MAWFPPHPIEEEVTLRVVIADQDPRTRALIKYALKVQQDAVIVGEASEGVEAAALVEYGEPDILIMDEALPGRSELDNVPSCTRVVLLSDRNGSDGESLSKTAVLAELQRFMMSVLNEGGVVDFTGRRSDHKERLR